MIKTELRGKLVAVLVIALIVTSVFSGAVSAGDSVASSNRESDNSAEGNYCNESTTGNATITSLNLSERIDEILEDGKSPFLFFYVDWCGFCEKQKPILEELEQEYGDPIEFIWLNVEQYREEAQEFGVNGYPTMFLVVGKDDERYLYKRFGGYTGRDELAEELDRVMETGTADNVRVMSFDENRRSDLGCSSCGNLSNFNLSITQENLTSDDFLKEISSDSESLELYNHANEMGYTRLNHSQKIMLNNETEVLTGTFISKEGDEITLVRISSSHLEMSYLIKSDNESVILSDFYGSKSYSISVSDSSSSCDCVLDILAGEIMYDMMGGSPCSIVCDTAYLIAPAIVTTGGAICGAGPKGVILCATVPVCAICKGKGIVDIINCGWNCYTDILYEVEGNVFYCDDGHPVKNAKVWMGYGSSGGKGGNPRIYGYTDNEGHFEAPLFWGDWEIWAETDTYISKSELLTGHTWFEPVTLELELYPKECYIAVAVTDENRNYLTAEVKLDGHLFEEKVKGWYFLKLPLSGYEEHIATISVKAEGYQEKQVYVNIGCESVITEYIQLKPALENGQTCDADGKCKSNHCALSCTGGNKRCCEPGQYWNEFSNSCVDRCECNINEDCLACYACDNGICTTDDTDPGGKCSGTCCGGICYAEDGVCCDGTYYKGENACCDENDCSSGFECIDHICLKSDEMACSNDAECKSENCNACEGRELHCCPTGLKWGGTKCVVDCYVTCAPTKCKQDITGREYSCMRCSEDEIAQGFCEESADGCFYGDPDDTRHDLCENCMGEDCINGYCESSVGCAEYKLPDDHGSIWCDDVTIMCNCPSTCGGALRLYDPMNFILPGDAGYLYDGCIYHGCYNCGADDMTCSEGNCIGGTLPEDYVCNPKQCVPDTVEFWNSYAKPKTSGECSYYTAEFLQKCAPASQRYTWIGEFCTDESGSPRPNPIKIDDYHWKSVIYYTGMKDKANLDICYEEKDWGCYENDNRNFKVYECKSPVPSHFYICDDDCYDPDYYECCDGRLVLKDRDEDGIQDHKCCIDRIMHTWCWNTETHDIIDYDQKDIINDPENCGGCGWKCTDVVNGACMDMERDYDHVCTGTKPQCCSGTCIEPSPVLSYGELSFYPGNVIESAEETVVVAVNYADPYNYGKNVDINLSIYIDNSTVGGKLISLSPGATKGAYFFWVANLSAGEHELKATIELIENITICSTLERTKMFTIFSKPDIAVKNLLLDITGTKSGDTVPITVTVQNSGSSNTNDFITTLSVDNDLSAYNLTSLAAGESKQISFNWTAILGEHNLTITADSLPEPDGLIPETNELNNSASQTVNILIKGNTTPVLSYTFESGYFFDGVEPDTGNESTIFEYRVKYMDYDNDSPASGHPTLWIDINGDGDYNDVIGGFAEGNFTMTEVDPSDSICTDGKIYSYTTTLPAGENLTYKFEAFDETGRNATGDTGVNNGPYVTGSESEGFIFDTGKPANPYPSIMGIHNGTIKPNQTVTVQKLYTYPCAGTGGHSEHVRIWNDTWIGKEAHWKGYQGDWHNITFDEPFTLFAEKTYYYEIRTGSYPQIIHKPEHTTLDDSFINCTSFVDANGKEHTGWIPAIRLWS